MSNHSVYVPTNGELDLLTLLAKQPIPVTRCYRLYRKRLHKAGYVTIRAWDVFDPKGQLMRSSMFVEITDEGKSFIASGETP